MRGVGYVNIYETLLLLNIQGVVFFLISSQKVEQFRIQNISLSLDRKYQLLYRIIQLVNIEIINKDFTICSDSFLSKRTHKNYQMSYYLFFYIPKYH